MGLDLPQLLTQVTQLAEETAARADQLRRRLPAAVEALQAASRLSEQDLAARIERAGDRWRGALPTLEPVTATYPPPAHPERLHLIGADGSQILPDRHGIASYYLINVGSLHLIHGTGLPPQGYTRPLLYFREQELYDEDQNAISPDMIAGQRDVAEMAELARQAEGSSGEPTVALLDNALLLWIALQERDHRRRQVQRVLQEYWDAMSRIRESGAALTGFVDRPGSLGVLALAHLASLPVESIDPAALRAGPFRGLLDRQLFGQILQPGYRSARFTSTSPLNREFQSVRHGIHFFYLHTGYQGQIARVEIPEWVSGSPKLLAWVHAGILEQCRLTGIPYPLIRAHELAVVAQADRHALEQMVSVALIRAGLEPRHSQKAETKRWTARRRRHGL